MEKTYWTRINADRKWGKNAYVCGVIEGIRLMLAGKETVHYIEDDTGDVHYSMTCTDAVYQKFMGLVNEKYPNLCDFDVEYKK